METRKLFFIDPQSYNNLATYDRSLLEGFKKYSVYFFGNTLYKEYIPDNVAFFPIFSYSTKKSNFTKVISYVQSLRYIMKAIIREKPSCVHIQWLRLWEIDFWFIKWLQRRDIKVIFTAHNLLPHDSGDKYRQKYLKYYRTIDHIIVHTSDTKHKLITDFEICPDKISVIRHGILKSTLDGKSISNCQLKLKSELNIENQLVFSSLGFQSLYKGTDNIIEAWTSSKQLYDNPNLILLIAGKNVNVDYSKISHIKNVRIIDDMVTDVEFSALVNLSSVVLLPYRTISQSGLLLTAISQNKPVIVSNAGGLSEPLEIAKIGWNIGPSSANELSMLMIHLSENPDEILAVTNDYQGFETIKTVYSWEHIATETERVYETLYTSKNNLKSTN